ncbi:aminoglycoside phosphotransferase family protein [Cognatishimia sp. F0-27]|uniref:aminoglycoside phosphotransferase family protein n=1 Tax=Cognatishimia sp. F0-27 TaxID=2816855 RepID=UPI001D0C686A|nr:phosphotransferase [Cognatishimia sp. F0-27]MCC1491177.1 phosphotransferase [Cognatishimia sp. F0-27]
MRGFLDRLGWADARQTPLAGDASARRYWRLSEPGRSAILMVDPGGDLALFARIANHLSDLGLSAPQIYGMDATQGRMLIEDLGDGLVARLAADAGREKALYRTAVDALVQLHRHPPMAGLATATPDRLAAMIAPAFTHYAPEAPGLRGLEEATGVTHDVMAAHAMPCDVMILRDYHAENILDLPERSGAARAGLLDFQDAMTGHRAYDLASLIRDARRDLRPGIAQDAVTHYLDHTGLDEAPFRAALAALSVQRNLRILGIFARLAQSGKPKYLQLIPRVWRHIQTDLDHPACTPLRPVVAALPHPTQDHLDSLRETRCRTV